MQAREAAGLSTGPGGGGGEDSDEEVYATARAADAAAGVQYDADDNPIVSPRVSSQSGLVMSHVSWHCVLLDGLLRRVCSTMRTITLL